MIRGYAVAGGLALAMGCDFRFAAHSAKLGDTSNKAGLLPDEGGAWLFPRAMGLDRALKMTLLHEIYPAPEAERLGLVTEVVPDDDLEIRTLAFCEALAAKAPLPVRLSKRMMEKARDVGREASMADAQMAVMIHQPQPRRPRRHRRLPRKAHAEVRGGGRPVSKPLIPAKAGTQAFLLRWVGAGSKMNHRGRQEERDPWRAWRPWR